MLNEHSVHGKAVVIGAGTMGSGIAQVAATSGLNVRMIDAAPDALSKGMQRINDSLARMVKKGTITAEVSAEALKRIQPSAESSAAVQWKGLDSACLLGLLTRRLAPRLAR